MGDEYVSVERLLLALADLKVQGRRLPLQEVALERRLQRALRAAFLQPPVYTPRVPTQEQEMLRPAPAGVGREGGGLSELSRTFPSTQLGTGGPAEDSWEDTVRARRRRPRHGRGEA